jgi:hypothetical protein
MIVGFVICDKHGGNTIVLCCKHIAKSIKSKEYFRSIIKVSIDLMGDKTELLEHYLCNECSNKYALLNNSILGEDAFGNDDILPANWPVCCICFEEKYGN